MNRYTNTTVSAYDPMSMQEIMMAPLTKRKQHDDTNATYQQYLAELAKVDPTDRDWEEAVKEKERISKQIQAGTELLNKEGYNNNTSSAVLNLNRDYQESISPTGKIGMFNANNAAMKAKKAEYLDNIVKLGYDAEDAQYWLDKAEEDYKNTPVYDEKGRVTGFSTDKYMPTKYVNDEDWRMKIFDKAGIREEDFARSGSTITQDEKGNYVVNSGRNWGSATNKPGLEAGLKYIQDELNRKDSDVRKSLEFQRKSVDDVLKNSENLKNVFITSKIKDHRESSISSFTPLNKNGEDDPTNIEAVNVEGVNLYKNENLLAALENKGKLQLNPKSFASSTAASKMQNTKELAVLNEALNSQEYLKLARGIVLNNPSKYTKNGKINYQDPLVVQDVIKYLEENQDVTVQNRYVDPNSNKTGMLFASKEIPKDKNAASSLILERAQRGAYDIVTEDGKKIDKNDLGKYTFTYSGDMTPKSQIGNKFNNPKQNIGARTGVLINKDDGSVTTVYVSRSSDDFNTPQFKAMETINAISKIVDTQPGIYHRMTGELFNSYGMKDVKIKYNKNKNTYDISYTDNEGKFVNETNVPDEIFQSTILDDYNNLYRN